MTAGRFPDVVCLSTRRRVDPAWTASGWIDPRHYDQRRSGLPPHR